MSKNLFRKIKEKRLRFAPIDVGSSSDGYSPVRYKSFCKSLSKEIEKIKYEDSDSENSSSDSSDYLPNAYA